MITREILISTIKRYCNDDYLISNEEKQIRAEKRQRLSHLEAFVTDCNANKIALLCVEKERTIDN